MKHLLLLLMLLLAAAGAAGVWITHDAPDRTPAPEAPAPVALAPRDLAGRPAAGERVSTLAVEGMCCQGCGGRLWEALAAQEGVREAAVDFDTATARAIVAVDVDDASLARALTFGKYAAHPRE